MNFREGFGNLFPLEGKGEKSPSQWKPKFESQLPMMQHKNQRSRKRPITTNTFEMLEQRNLLAAIAFNNAGQLYISGDINDNVGTLSVSDNKYFASVDSVSKSFDVGDVKEIYFLGFGGDDTFNNNTSSFVSAYGHAGDDTLNGGSGRDALIGGSGNDTLYGNGGDDRLVGANDNDKIFGGDGNDRIFGTSGSNELHGEAGDDIMYGSDDGDDIMNGGEGLDWIFGLGGDDTLDAGNGGSLTAGELVMGHGGHDSFFAGDGLNLFWGGDGNDTMTGGIDGINRMHGQGGDDVMTGGDKADLIRGHAGNDTLTGKGGNDTIEAGSDDGDIVSFSNTFKDSNIEISANGQDVKVAANGNDRVLGAEWLSFSDRQVSSDLADLSAPEAASLTELNDYRNVKSRPTMSAPTDLTKFAEDWSKQMAKVGLSHSSEASRRGLLVGGRSTVGENVIQVPDTGQTATEIAAEMHHGWVNSAVHHANIVNANFNEIGIGIYKSGGFWWGTHVFAG